MSFHRPIFTVLAVSVLLAACGGRQGAVEQPSAPAPVPAAAASEGSTTYSLRAATGADESTQPAGADGVIPPEVKNSPEYREFLEFKEWQQYQEFLRWRERQ